MTLKAHTPLPALVIMAAALMLSAPAAFAIPMTFGGILSGANESPPVATPGAGSVAVVLDPTAQTIQIIASFFGLTTPDTAAHIHCCQPPTNVGVATTVPAFAGFPLGVTQGTYLSPIFSLLELFVLQSGLCHDAGRAPTGRGGADRGNRERGDIFQHPHHTKSRR